ncbi:MAG: alpha/beta fold hydrolase [Planctomycetota bacterium]
MHYRPNRTALSLLVLSALALPGCVSERIAIAFTDAPNGGLETVNPERVGPPIFDRQGEVDVPGPPPATLAYWVMEPGPGHVSPVPDSADPPTADAPPGWRVLDAKANGSPAFLRTLRGPQRERADARATVVVLQGWGTRVRTADYLLHLNTILADAGCRVICPDLRGHGDSTGEFVTSGYREVEDLSALLDDFQQRGLLQGPVGVIGHSYGGGIAIQFAAHDPRVERVLALSPLVDIRPAMLPGIRAFLQEMRPIQWTLYLQWLINQDAIDLAQQKMQQRTGADLAVHNALHQISRVEAPVLVLQGDDDIATPLAGAERLREANPEAVELVVYPGGDHTSYLRDDFADLEPRLRTWVEGLAASAPRDTTATRDTAPSGG